MVKKKNNKEVVMFVVLLLLFSFSVFQFFEIEELKGGMMEGNVGYAKSTGQVPRASGNVPTNLQNLPDMVGGC